MSVFDILHVFADKGAENPTLSNYGNVLRLSIDVTGNKWSNAVQADATTLPLQPDAEFDIGWFHPPCGGVSIMSETGSGSREDWPDLIPVARDIAQEHCNHWVIENKPRESLDAEVVLDGHMFNLDIEYKRAFETSFSVEQPPQQSQLAETSPFFYTEKPHGWWAGVKGSSTEFSKDHLAKNTIPAAYIDYIMRHHAEAVASDDLPNYDDYNKRMDAKRAKTENDSLEAYQ
jgi:hypothetical protein